MKQKLHALAPWLFAMLGYIYDIAFFINHGRAMLDSDMAAEMVLANLMYKEHALLTKSWIYSTEIRAAGMQWFYCIGFWFAKDNWLMARTIGVAIALIIYFCAWMYLSKVLGWGQTGKWIIAFLAWPFGFWYFFDIIWGAYYLPHSIFMVLSLALAIVAAKERANNRKAIVALVGLGIISLVSGLNGMRMLVIFFLPLAVAGAVILYLSFRNNGKEGWFDKTSVKHRFAVITFIAMFCNLVGYGINLKLFVNRYKFLNMEGMAWGKGSGSWLKTFKWYFDSFGYTDFSTKEVFSLGGIGAGCGLLLGFAVLFSIIRLVMNYKKLDEAGQIYIASLMAIFLVIGVVFTYAWGEEQYWLPIVHLGVGALFLELKTDPLFKEFEVKALHYIVLVLAMISAVGIIKCNVAHPLRANQDFAPVIDFIEDKGYTKGVASFWRSQVVAELTNGQVEMWTLSDDYDYVDSWLQYSSHLEIPTGEFFGLYPAEDTKGMDTFRKTFKLDEELVYDDGKYVIYQYKN